MEITADVIVELYTKFQLFSFWKMCGFTAGGISGLDLADTVGKEISEMWGLLKGVLVK